MNVTPLSEAPIMPKATTYQGERRSPMKKASLPAPREVSLAMNVSRRK